MNKTLTVTNARGDIVAEYPDFEPGIRFGCCPPPTAATSPPLMTDGSSSAPPGTPARQSFETATTAPLFMSSATGCAQGEVRRRLPGAQFGHLPLVSTRRLRISAEQDERAGRSVVKGEP